MNSMDTFGHFIDKVTFYHQKWCLRNNWSNFAFVNKTVDVFIDNVIDNNRNNVKNLQKVCKEFFGNFYSLTIFSAN